MSDLSEEEDSIDNIDFSVISTAIEAGGKTLDQILNAVHYGSPEVRHLLREACDFIFECKYCKNLFRSIPNFIAHKRIYCGEKSFFPRSTPKKKSKKKDEVVIVRPVSPSLSVPIETNSKDAEKTVLEQILTGSFQGTSEAYKHYTEAAENIERQKLNTMSTIVMTTSIKNTENAVNVQVLDKPNTTSSATVSNASVIIANAKNARKQPLTKIVDDLKKSAKNAKVVTETSTVTDSPKKFTEKNKQPTDVAKGDNESKFVVSVVKGFSNAIAPSQPNLVGKVATRTENTAVQKQTEKIVIIEQKSGNSNLLTRVEKAAKIVLTPLSQLSPNLAKRLTAKEDVLPQKSGMTETVSSTKVFEKKEVSKATSSTDLRPVKSQDGSELSELSQLGHCDLNRLMCLICNLQYSQKKTLLQHMHVIHSGSKKKYPCNMCNKTFDYFWGLTRHLLLNHKKTKEEIDRMRPELRALAYTVTELEKNNGDQLSIDKPKSENQDTFIRSSRTKQMTKALVKMNTCNGCNKSFWKKSNYEEHMKQCRFLSTMPSSSKVQSNSTSESINEKSDPNNLIMSRRQRTVEKLSESRKTIYDSGEDDSSSVHSTLENSSTIEQSKSKAASKRLRVQGKFVSKKVALKMLEQEKKEKDEQIKEKEKEKKSNTAKNKVVQKLKEKSHSFVPAQRFISTRRSAAFYNSPAQRTRFHEKRRAVVSNSKKDTKSPSKSPTKSASELSEFGNESAAKNSFQEKSELEVARRNLLHAIEKVKKHDIESPEQSVLSGKMGSSATKSSLNENKEEFTSTNSGHKGKTDTLEIGRSRSAVRRQLPSSENFSERPKCSAKKADKKTPSRDTSFDSTMSSERSFRDTSSELSCGNFKRSTQKVVSETKTGSNFCKSHHMPQKDTLEYHQTPRTRSRDTSKESIGGPTENTSGKDDEKKASGRSRSSVKHSRSDVTESRDSSKESVRTCSTENLTDMKSLGSVTRQSESQECDEKVVRTSPRSENSAKMLKSKDTENNSSAKNTKATNQSPGKDEIDGLKLGDHSAEKRQPKWSSKNWDSKEDMLIGKEQSKNKCEGQSSVKVQKCKEKGKGVIKRTVLKGKARYSTRSMKTRIQEAKKMGELKKRCSTRISSKKISSESPDCDDKNTKVQLEIDKKTPISKTVDKKEKPTNKDNTNKKSGQNFKKDENVSKNYELCKKVDAAQQVDDENEEVKEQKITYAHRQRHASDMQGVKVIEEIWVSKEPGKPLQNVKCKKTIIDSPKKLKASRMYVVDPIQPEKPKCMDFSRINHLVDYKNNKCLQCGIELSDISSLRRHAVRHLGWKRYKCKLCAYTGFNRSECNSHIKRRHAEKLITSSAPLSSFIIDLNKEASNVRNKKKQTTLQRKNTGEKKSTKTTTTSQTECKPLRSSATKSVNEEENLKVEGDDINKSHESEISVDAVKEIQKIKKSRSNSGPAIVSPDRSHSGLDILSPDRSNSGTAIISPDNEARLTRKRKRAVSEEGPVNETKGDNLTTEPSNLDTEVQEQQRSENVSETKDTENEFDEEIRSVSDYEENSSEGPQRNVVSPTWTKMNPNVALMMATLEEARATKFARGKRGRGGIRRFSSPIKKQARLSTDDYLDQEHDCNEEEDDGKIDDSKEIDNDGKIQEKDCAEKHDDEVQTDLSQTEGQSSDAVDDLSSRKLDIVQSDEELICNKKSDKVQKDVSDTSAPSNNGVQDCETAREIVNEVLEENVDKSDKNLKKELQTDHQTENDSSSIQEISQNVKVDVEPGKNSVSKQDKDVVEGSLLLDKKIKAEKLEEESI